MRRSNAPSLVGNAAKRPKFQVPAGNGGTKENINEVASKFGINLNESKLDESATSHDEKPIRIPLEESRITDPVTQVKKTSTKFVSPGMIKSKPNVDSNKIEQPSLTDLNSTSSHANQNIEKGNSDTSSAGVKSATFSAPKKTFKAPSMFKPPSAAFVSPMSNEKLLQLKTKNAAEETPSGNEEYYSVVWCKASTKKHKKWEGDGILIVCGKQVTLKDMEGKQIAKGSGYKLADIKDMCDGSSLKISGKEIEVQGKINREDYLTGKCFFSPENQSTSAPMSLLPRAAPKAFIPHNMPAGDEKKNEVVLTPRHDPNKEGALVMPRPTNSSQSNAKKQKIVDVVVDPFISYHLRPHQREGVTFLYECVMGMRPTPGNGAILADEMGLGKTLQCISLIWTLLKQSPFSNSPSVKKVIIITPGSLVKNWCQEIIKWLGSERLKPFAINSANRVDEFLLHNNPVMVISYEMFLRCIEDVRKAKFNLVICDEAHRLKNARIKTGTALASLGIAKRVLLTGTPVQNNLEEFYTLAEMAIPGILGTLSVFKKVFIEPITRSQQPDSNGDEKELGASRTAELGRLISSFCLRRTAEINKAYLPPKVEHAVFIRMSPLQLRIYQHLLKTSLVRSCLSYSYSGNSHLVCIDAMKKVCNDPKLIYSKCESNLNSDQEDFFVSSNLKSVFPDDFMSENSLSHSAKLQVVDKMLQSFTKNKEKCVIISNSTKALDIIEEFCTSMGYTSVRLDGQTQMANRQSIVNRFNDKTSNIFVFLLSSKAGGVGLNLTGASKLILYDIDWNPANDMQSMARVWRDGQKKEVHIYRFIMTSSIEEKMYQRQVSKQALSGTVVDSAFANTEKVEFSNNDLKDLFTLKETSTCCTHDLLQCSCDREDGGQTSTQQNSGGNQRNTSMAELMQWEHISDISTADDLDYGLASCENISFLFRSRSG